jgi:hypothetical protein
LSTATSAAFFSYSRDDSEFALRLAEDLKSAGASVWLDQMDIEAGQDWDTAVEGALTQAPRMLLILSPSSVKSKNVRNEISFALDEQKNIVPVLYRDCTVPLQLHRVQYIDFRTDYARGLKALLDAFGVGRLPAQELKSHAGPPQNNGGPPYPHESFTDGDQWPFLLRIGSWKLDANTNVLQGKGVYEFLLSRHSYGKRNFRIKASLVFINYDQFRDAGVDTANAGIVLGWQEHGRGHRYYNLLFTGGRLLLEAVGFSGSDDYRDFKHSDEGVQFQIQEERSYDFGISVTDSVIDVFINNELRYSVSAPKDLIGRVGLRPWRAEILCSKFMIVEG